MSENEIKLPGFGRGLSARVLLLTILFVMVSEVLIYLPSIARFRTSWLEERLSIAHLATLALEATPDYMLDPQLEVRLLNHARVRVIALRDTGGKNLMLRGSTPPLVLDDSINLDDRGFMTQIREVIKTLVTTRNRTLRVKGVSPQSPDVTVDVVLDEWPLHQDLIAYSWRILGLSIVISLITAALIFGALQWLIIRPMGRLTAGMVAFRQDPEEGLEEFGGSRRGDEIGVAEREFAELQRRVRRSLKQKARLAALGTAVGKINHDLRGMLATARLVADRLAESDDPEVRKAAPALVRALDRAVDLCSDTLNFTREGPARPEPEMLNLAALVAEVGESLGKYLTGGKQWVAEVPADFSLVADRAQLFRILRNLGENALQMGAGRVRIGMRSAPGRIEIVVADDGPGLPPKAVENLFVPFKGSARAGGTGLGLAIARELMRVQGGDLRLDRTDARGTVFVLDLPEGPRA